MRDIINIFTRCRVFGMVYKRIIYCPTRGYYELFDHRLGRINYKIWDYKYLILNFIPILVQ